MSNTNQGESVDLPELARRISESLRQTLATRLAIEWSKQNAGKSAPGGYAALTISIDYKLLRNLCEEAGRNTAQAISYLTIECSACGEVHSPDRCPWIETCGECSRTGVAMAADRLCEDCRDSQKRVAARQQRIDDAEGYGDHMRDMQKGA